MNDFVIDTKKYPKPRSRHHNAANVYFPLHQLDRVPRYYPPIVSDIDWKSIYKNGNPPNILDIGCGWGSFLLNYANLNPHSNILGIEIRKLLTEWINGIIIGEHVSNAHALWYSLPNGLSFLQNQTIDQFFSFFPDPWVKKKHHKRRAFSLELIQEILRLAKNDAMLYIMTDVPEVAEYHIALLDSFPSIKLTHAEYIGELDHSWEGLIRSFENLTSDDSWNLPKTDQELFSMKKNISYIRLKYAINPL